MKIFKRENRVEGQFPKGAIFITGDSTDYLNVYNGWFIRFEIPFTFNMSYRDPNDFTEKYGPCRLVKAWIFRAKKPTIKITAKIPQ